MFVLGDCITIGMHNIQLSVWRIGAGLFLVLYSLGTAFLLLLGFHEFVFMLKRF